MEFEPKSMKDLELDETLNRDNSDLSQADWDWVDQTVDSVLESLGIDLQQSLGLEDIDLNKELDELFAELGLEDPDGMVSEEYVNNLSKLYLFCNRKTIDAGASTWRRTETGRTEPKEGLITQICRQESRAAKMRKEWPSNKTCVAG